MWATRLLCPWDSPGTNIAMGCHFLLQGDLPNPGIELASPMSPALAGRFFTTSPLRGKEGNIKEQSLLFSIVVVFKYVQKFFITPLSNEWI